MKKWIYAAGVLAAGALAYLTLAPSDDDADTAKTPAVELRRGGGKREDDPKKAVREAMGTRDNASKPARGKSEEKPSLDIFQDLKGVDKKLAQSVQDAIDANDFNSVIAAAGKAMASTNAEVRAGAVEALAWFGADALPELTGAMADRDEDVATAAGNAWEIALGDINSASQRFDVAAAALGTLPHKDNLESVRALLVNSALELIDDEDDPDKASDNRVKVLQALVDIIETDGAGVNKAAAKEAYADITGSPYLGFDEAEAYLADPENYTAPEDD